MSNETKILIIDIETTGFFNKGGSIVEIGMVELDLSSGATQIVFDSLIKEDILDAHHYKDPMGWIFKNSTLTPDDVRDADPANIVLPKVQAITDAYPLGCTAYNKRFDFEFLQDRGIIIKELPCPMILATNVCKLPGRYGQDYKWPSVEETWRNLFPSQRYTELHRGADDALHEAAIVYELYKRGIFCVNLE